MLTLFLIYGIWYLRYYLSKYIVTLKELRIIYMEFYILNTILFFLFYICLLGYWRFLNTDRTLDLNFYIYHTYTFLKNNNIFDTIITFICFICFMIFLYYLIFFLRKYFTYHFLKLDIFLTYISQGEDFFEESKYDKFIEKFSKISRFSYRIFINKPITFFHQLYLDFYNINYKHT